MKDLRKIFYIELKYTGQNGGREWQRDLLITTVATGLDPTSPNSQASAHSTTRYSFSPWLATLRGGRSKSRQSGRSKGDEKPQASAVDGT